jgi:hypothetical protein
MAKQEAAESAISMSSTKKEMLDAYNQLVKQFKEKREAEMKPEHKIEEKHVKEAVETADALSLDAIAREIGNLKSEIGAMLLRLSDRLEDEARKYAQLKRAVESKEKELCEIHEIEHSAASLDALLELQERKRGEFEAEMARQKDSLREEMERTRELWAEEKTSHDLEVKERDTAEKKKREREAEEYKYQFEREKQLAREKFEDEKARMERDLVAKREATEKELAEREFSIAEREKILAEAEKGLQQLRARVAAFPGEQDSAVQKAAQSVTERLKAEAKTAEELLRREFTGEKNVLLSKIESLQQTVKEQAQQVNKISAQLEKSYGQVQDIAVKAIEGSAVMKGLAGAFSSSREEGRQKGEADRG